MKKLLTAFIAILTISIVTTSCEKKEATKKATVTINVKNGSGVVQSGVDVYMYDETVFKTQGNDPFFAKRTATTNSEGNAVFEIINQTDVLWTPVSSSVDFYFGVVYKISGVNKEKHTVISVSEGDSKSANLVEN